MFRLRIVSLYILKDMLPPFFLGLMIFTLFLLMNKVLRLMELIINRGLPFSDVIILISYLAPSLMVLTIPIAVILSILICFGKLTADSEIIALRASGVSIYQMLPAFSVLCILSFFFCNLLSLYIVPKSNNAFRDLLFDVAKKHTEATLEEGVFNDFFPDIVVYIAGYDRQENLVRGIFISDTREADHPTVISAEKAHIISQPERSRILFKLSNGNIHRFDGKAESYHYAVFDKYEMGFSLLGDEEREGRRRVRELDTAVLFNLYRDRDDPRFYRIAIEFHRRLAYPFGCLVFGILGISLGYSRRKGGRSYGFVVSIIIVFLYYVFLNIGENMTRAGYLPFFAGVWLPNIILGAFAIYLFKKSAAEKPVPFVVALERYTALMNETIKKLPGAVKEKTGAKGG